MSSIYKLLPIRELFFLGILFSFAYDNQALANFKFEPYLGYWTGKLEQDSNYYMATSGLMLGSRIGYGFGQLKLGGDYMYSSGSGNQSGSTGEYSINEFGPYIGIEIPGFGQAYVSAFISSKAKIQPEINPQLFKGSGFRLGIGGFGWARLQSLSLNLELISRSYSQYNNQDLSQKQKELSFALTMSLPLPGSGGGYSGASSASDSTP